MNRLVAMRHIMKSKKWLIGLLTLIFGVSSIVQYAPTAHANQYDERIKALQQEVSQYQSQAATLQNKANTLQEELNRLGTEKAGIQAKVDLSQAQYDKLEKQIKETEAKIAANREALGATIADLYVEGEISSLEMIASSKNISDYLDKQQYLSATQNQLSKTIKKIGQLKADLGQQKIAVERTLTDEKNAREALAVKETERQNLLAQTSGEEAAYQKLATDRQSQADKLRAEQIAANMRAAQRGGSQTIVSGVAGGGGYPGKWANAPMDTLVDDWSLYNRQCVSYVAWKIASTGRFVPKFNGQGNANQWENYVARYGITSGSTPVAGSAAVLYEGAYGHIMYVEAVSDDKSRITISEYNYGWTGLYSKRTISSSGLRYLYF